MKIGPFDGSTQEVSDLLENNGLKVDDYLEKPLSPLKCIFIVIPSVILFMALCLMVLPVSSATWFFNLLNILSFGSATWICTGIQIRFKNGIATFCVAMGIIITMLIAAGFISPREAAEIVRGLKGK